MAGPIRADHLGSFLRPPELLEARQRVAKNPGSAQLLAELHALEDTHVRRVVAKQQELGFQFATDGELRRNNFMSDFLDAVDGFDTADAVARAWHAAGGKDGAQGELPRVSSVTGVVTQKLRQHRRLTAHELDFLQSAANTTARPATKITLPSATQFPAIAFKDGITDKVYKDRTELLWDIVEILKKEVAALALSGADYIQIDAPRYSYYLDPKWREWIRAEMRREPDAILAESLRADAECLKAARTPDSRGHGPTLGFHLCRGNNRSQWYAEGSYDAIADKMFNMLPTDRWLLEYDDERSGSFEPLRFMPKSATVVLGLVSSKKPQLEDAGALARRIDDAAKYIPLERLALSPQCGFASTAEGNLLTEDEQWAKLKLVADTARHVWK